MNYVGTNEIYNLASSGEPKILNPCDKGEGMYFTDSIEESLLKNQCLIKLNIILIQPCYRLQRKM